MDIIGFIAAFITTFAFLPQTIKTIVTRKTESISLIMYVMFSSGVFLWIIYALYIENLAILLANIFTFIFSALITSIKLINVLKQKERI